MITYSLHGGFHNSARTTIRVTPQTAKQLMLGAPLSHLLTEGQARRLQKHFCGIAGCTCGSYSRAAMELRSHRLVPA